jgi:hypothetical protein
MSGNGEEQQATVISLYLRYDNTTAGFVQQLVISKKEHKMSYIRFNQTLVVTALLVTAVILLLSVPMTEGLLQENHGNLRRQLDDPSPIAASPSDEMPLSRVKLLTAGKFAVLSKTGVMATGAIGVTGAMGTSPISATAMTGFGLIMDSGNAFSTSTLVSGNVHEINNESPTPNMTVAFLDMQAAYVDAAGRPDPDYADLGAGSIEGLTLDPGLYKWSTDVEFTSSLTFNGTDTDIWILQIDGDVKVGSGAIVELTGGALAENIFWQIAGKTTLGTSSHVEGVFLCKTQITFETGSSMNGAALAQTAVTLDAAIIVRMLMSLSRLPCFTRLSGVWKTNVLMNPYQSWQMTSANTTILLQ